MIHLITEENKELKNRLFPLSKGIKKHLQNTLTNYSGDKTIDGYKRLNNLLNTKGGISYSEMKRIKNFFDNYQGTDKSFEFILNGGEPMKMWVNNTLYSATKAIHDFKQTKKDAGMQNAFIKTHEKDRQSKKKNKPTQVKFKTNNANKNIKNNELLKFESKLHETNEYYYDVLSENDAYSVLMDFIDNPQGTQNWQPLINPSMYQKALSEFTKFGKIEHFPTHYIHQWMGIIMRNTAKLRANTMLAGHDNYYPYEEISDFLETYFNDTEWDLNDNKISYINDNGENVEKDILDFFGDLGLYDWMKAPDGSDAWSDYGIQPIEKLIDEYDDTKTPEETLVIINKILDVYHCRGDLSSLFINGGTKVLYQTSNGLGLGESKTIYITETQMKQVLFKLNEAQNEVFSLQELSNISSFKNRYQYCLQNLGKPQGRGSSRVIFQLDDEKILKLAYNRKGVAQNQTEYDGFLDSLGVVPHTYDSDDNGLWLVSEYVLPAKEQDFKHCLNMSFEEFKKFIASDWAWRLDYTKAKNGGYNWVGIYPYDEYVEILENNEDLNPFDEYIGNYQPPLGDLLRLVNYGMTMREGYPTIVLLDAGLSEEVWNNYYKQ